MVVEGSEFKNAVLMASKVADNVVFSADEVDEGFHMIAEGDIEEVRIELDSYSGEQAKGNVKA